MIWANFSLPDFYRAARKRSYPDIKQETMLKIIDFAGTHIFSALVIAWFAAFPR
jgi:hypothetical protein